MQRRLTLAAVFGAMGAAMAQDGPPQGSGMGWFGGGQKTTGSHDDGDFTTLANLCDAAGLDAFRDCAANVPVAHSSCGSLSHFLSSTLKCLEASCDVACPEDSTALDGIVQDFQQFAGEAFGVFCDYGAGCVLLDGGVLPTEGEGFCGNGNLAGFLGCLVDGVANPFFDCDSAEQNYDAAIQCTLEVCGNSCDEVAPAYQADVPNLPIDCNFTISCADIPLNVTAPPTSGAAQTFSAALSGAVVLMVAVMAMAVQQL